MSRKREVVNGELISNCVHINGEREREKKNGWVLIRQLANLVCGIK